MCLQGDSVEPSLAIPEDNAQLQKELRETAKRHAMNDLAAGRKEYMFAPPGFIDRPLKSLLNDQRDAPIAYVFFNILTTVVPGTVALYLLPASHLLGVVYLALTQLNFLPRFALALHYSVHRTLFINDRGTTSSFQHVTLRLSHVIRKSKRVQQSFRLLNMRRTRL